MVGRKQNVVIGRDPDCDICVNDPSVSARHARIVMTRKGMVLEDLGSANGTFVGTERIKTQRVRPGDDIRIANTRLPWSHQALLPFVRATAGKTVPLSEANPGVVSSVGNAPGRPRKRSGVQLVGFMIRTLFWTVVFAAIAAGVYYFGFDVAETMARRSRDVVQRVKESPALGPPPKSEKEAIVRMHQAKDVATAIDTRNPVTRNSAVKLAAKSQGPFHVDQVARVWLNAFKNWKYVNDPKGNDYYAKASESIANDYAGDCDDFAIVVVAMITAIGGEARIVVMEAEEGGHAYPEVKVQGSLKATRIALDKFARRNLKGKRVREVHARPAKPAPGKDGEEKTETYWLNLDWFAQVPGGPYNNEKWAVAIYPDGSTETLAPAKKTTPDKK